MSNRKIRVIPLFALLLGLACSQDGWAHSGEHGAGFASPGATGNPPLRRPTVTTAAKACAVCPGLALPRPATQAGANGTARGDAAGMNATSASWLAPALLGLLGLLLCSAALYVPYATWRERKQRGALRRACSNALRGLAAGTAASILAYVAADLVFHQIITRGNFRGTFLSPVLAMPSAAAVMLLVFVLLSPVFYWLFGLAARMRRGRGDR
ncbi:MAG: hypothetical protein JNM98_08325 [Rhodocyclaceae bacterium]|nr:hypothetical protein [Rhodocyclaceae bacterium]